MTSEVTSEDQVKINKFAILHDKYGVIKAKLAQKHVCFFQNFPPITSILFPLYLYCFSLARSSECRRCVRRSRRVSDHRRLEWRVRIDARWFPAHASRRDFLPLRRVHREHEDRRPEERPRGVFRFFLFERCGSSMILVQVLVLTVQVQVPFQV